MCRLQNIAMRDYQESVTTGQTDTRTDVQKDTQDKVIPMCNYASQAPQKWHLHTFAYLLRVHMTKKIHEEYIYIYAKVNLHASGLRRHNIFTPRCIFTHMQIKFYVHMPQNTPKCRLYVVSSSLILFHHALRQQKSWNLSKTCITIAFC